MAGYKGGTNSGAGDQRLQYDDHRQGRRWGGSLRRLMPWAIGLFVVTSVVQSRMEHPEHDFLSAHGIGYAFQRTAQNAYSIASGVGSFVTAPIRWGLEAANAVRPGTQPATYYITCMDPALNEKLKNRDPRAEAYNDELNIQVYDRVKKLRSQSDTFYTSHAGDYPTQPPVPVLHLKDVPWGWNPKIGNSPSLLAEPTAYSQQKSYVSGACNAGWYVKKLPLFTP